MIKAKTPCIGICSTTSLGDSICRGCKRYAFEVINWNSYEDNQKKAVLSRIEKFNTQIIENKLRFLAYVEADRRKTDEGEEFHYKSCTIFFNSSFDKFMTLLKDNKIQYDIRIGSYKTPGRKNYGKLHDHGSGFRINKNDMPKIFETHHTL